MLRLGIIYNIIYNIILYYNNIYDAPFQYAFASQLQNDVESRIYCTDSTKPSYFLNIYFEGSAAITSNPYNDILHQLKEMKFKSKHIEYGICLWHESAMQKRFYFEQVPYNGLVISCIKLFIILELLNVILLLSYSFLHNGF